MPEALYHWKVYDVTSPWKQGKHGAWRELTWAMTEADALQWANANGFYKIERVPNSGTQYAYVGHFQEGREGQS